MLPLPWLVLVVAPLVFSQPAPQNCCETKTVGGVSYTFVREDTTAISYSCLSPCVYERDDQPGTAFCFAQGDQQVVCGDDSAGTEGGEEGEDNIEATVKSLIDAGTCDGVSYASDATTDECGDAATSYYKEFMYNGKRVIVSNNIPDHPAEQDALAPNPNIRCAGWQFVQLEVDPEVGDTVTDTGLGTIGLAVTGGAFFNHLEAVSKGRRRRRRMFPMEESTTTMETLTAPMLGLQLELTTLTNVSSSATTWMEFPCTASARIPTTTT